MNIQALRYIVAIERTGSINKAAQNLFVSQSSLSRTLQNTEAQIGISLFQRTNHGVIPTHDGQKFIDQAKHLLREIDQLEGRYFSSAKTLQNTLLVATQRCSPVIYAFIEYYQQHCTQQDLLNLALQEETTDNIIRLVCDRIYGIGILHYTSDQEENFLRKCRSLDLEYHLLEQSPVCAQVRAGHPLACHDRITVDMLAPYPHVTFSDEDITSINYCSDVSQYNPSILKKRIIIQDRGTLHEIINNTDSYYIGCDFTRFSCISPNRHLRYIPLQDVHFTLNTIWIQRSGHVLTQPEQAFIKVLESIYARSRGGESPAPRNRRSL